MTPTVLLYQLLVVALVLSCLLMHVWGLSSRSPASQRPFKPATPRRKRAKDPKPFTGYIHKPLCEACVQGVDTHPKASDSPPALLTCTRGRRRTVDTSQHFCPDHDCSYHGWRGRGNIRANGHPGGQPWRPWPGVSCKGYCSETHGTIFYEKRSSEALIVRVIACLAEGLGIRGTARVFESDPNTVLGGWVEAAEPLKAFSADFLRELPRKQVQLDELYAVLRAVRDGDTSEAEAIERLSRAPHWGWTALDPESTLLLSVQGGNAPWPWPKPCDIRSYSSWRLAVGRSC